MRRSIVLLLCFLGLALIGFSWWFFRSKQLQENPGAINAVPLVTNFSELSSPAFEADGKIPKNYTCDGENKNPPLIVNKIPPAVKFFAIVFDDPDAKRSYDHWVIWDIPRGDGTIEENTPRGVIGKNSERKNEYTGPCSVPTEHRYRFRVWGYTQPLALAAGSSRASLLKKLSGRAIVTAELYGRYQSQ